MKLGAARTRISKWVDLQCILVAFIPITHPAYRMNGRLAAATKCGAYEILLCRLQFIYVLPARHLTETRRGRGGGWQRSGNTTTLSKWTSTPLGQPFSPHVLRCKPIEFLPPHDSRILLQKYSKLEFLVPLSHPTVRHDPQARLDAREVLRPSAMKRTR